MKFGSNIPIENDPHVYLGPDVLDANQETLINLVLNGGNVEINLKQFIASNIFKELQLTAIDLINVSKFFNVIISCYPSGNIGCVKFKQTLPESKELYFGIANSDNKQYLIGFYYFEKQPTVYSLILDQVYLVT